MYSLTEWKALPPWLDLGPNIFPSGPPTQSISILSYAHWLNFQDFENFVLTQIGRDRQARAEKTFYVKIFPQIFWVRTRDSQFIEKRDLFSHFCSLLSLKFYNNSEENIDIFFLCLFFFATKPYKRTSAGRLFRTGSRQHVRRYLSHLPLWFSMGLRKRSRYESYDNIRNLVFSRSHL